MRLYLNMGLNLDLDTIKSFEIIDHHLTHNDKDLIE